MSFPSGMAVALMLLFLLLGFKQADSKTRPNIIFILADDLAVGSAGFGPSGSDSDMEFATPILNSWAEKGIVFSNYYSQESCTPARAAFMTGRFPLSIGMQYGAVEASVSWGLNMSETIFPEVLKSKGSYTNYQLGKWNLGHFTPKLLPTARGFDYYLGYQSGNTEYWSKFADTHKSSNRDTSNIYFTDLTYGDGTCYSGYSGSDKHQYSTWLYRDKAINIIKHHNYDEKPLFLYLAFQAVHDPFSDVNHYDNGVPKEYVGSTMYKKIKKYVVGQKRRQYAMALYLMDEAIGKIEEEVTSVGQDSNTYYIFTSDNGGCAEAGGRNGAYRGNKGTLFEGGTKVDALLYSTKLSSKQQGATYGGLMHVVDWFPTMLDMANINYKSPSGYSLDGVSHWKYLSKVDSTSTTISTTSPRTSMLYGYYTDVESVSIPSDTPVRAVRNSQYKYIESYVDTEYMGWASLDIKEDDDSLDSLGSCEQSNSWKLGSWGAYLFDLENDPYETTNLADDTDYAKTVATMKGLLTTYYEKRKEDTKVYNENNACFVAFKAAGDYVVPWNFNDADGAPAWSKKCSKSLISPDSTADVDDDDWIDTDPTVQPTHSPSASPAPSV